MAAQLSSGMNLCGAEFHSLQSAEVSSSLCRSLFAQQLTNASLSCAPTVEVPNHQTHTCGSGDTLVSPCAAGPQQTTMTEFRGPMAPAGAHSTLCAPADVQEMPKCDTASANPMIGEDGSSPCCAATSPLSMFLEQQRTQGSSAPCSKAPTPVGYHVRKEESSSAGSMVADSKPTTVFQDFEEWSHPLSERGLGCGTADMEGGRMTVENIGPSKPDKAFGVGSVSTCHGHVDEQNNEGNRLLRRPLVALNAATVNWTPNSG